MEIICGDSEAQRWQSACSKSHSKSVAKLELEPRASASRSAARLCAKCFAWVPSFHPLTNPRKAILICFTDEETKAKRVSSVRVTSFYLLRNPKKFTHFLSLLHR